MHFDFQRRIKINNFRMENGTKSSTTTLSSSEEEILRKQKHPSVSIETAKVLAESLWGLSVLSVKALDSYDDNNFLIIVETEMIDANVQQVKKYLLKIHNGVESSQENVLNLQTTLMEHLHENGVEAPFPIVPSSSSTTLHISTLSSKNKSEDDVIFDSSNKLFYVPLECQDGTLDNKLAVRLLRWVEGETMVSTGVCHPDFLKKVGTYLGGVTEKLSNFDHIGAHRCHLWDLQNFSNIRSFVKYIKSKERQNLILSIIDAFEQEVLPLVSDLPKSVILGDYNDANIILDNYTCVNENNSSPSTAYNINIVGVIDFGDSVFSWRCNELAIALAYVMLSPLGKDEGKPILAVMSLLQGFASKVQLIEAEVSVLRILVAVRLAISVTLGAYSLSKDPSNSYLLLHAEPGWRMLELYWEKIDPVSLQALFRKVVDAAQNEEENESGDILNLNLEEEDKKLVSHHV